MLIINAIQRIESSDTHIYINTHTHTHIYIYIYTPFQNQKNITWVMFRTHTHTHTYSLRFMIRLCGIINHAYMFYVRYHFDIEDGTIAISVRAIASSIPVWRHGNAAWICPPCVACCVGVHIILFTWCQFKFFVSFVLFCFCFCLFAFKDGSSECPPMWVAKCVRDAGDSVRNAPPKQFAHNWQLSYCQWKEICSHVPMQNDIYGNG